MGISVVQGMGRGGSEHYGEVRASSVVLLPHTPTSVSAARRHLSADLFASGVLDSVIDDATVIVSELLSNSLRHARPMPSGQIQVAWSCDGQAVELAVTDGGAATEPRRGRPALSSLGGRGLGIVATLAESWGVRHDDGGSTTVWALLRIPHSADQVQRIPAVTPLTVVSVATEVSGTPLRAS